MCEMDQKRLQDIADELKEDAERILECKLVLIQDSLVCNGDGFFPVAKFSDGKPRKTGDKNFIVYGNKKCFSKKIGKFEYLLAIIDLD